MQIKGLSPSILYQQAEKLSRITEYFQSNQKQFLTLMTQISTKSGKQRNIEENYVISNSLTFSLKTYKDKGLDTSTGRDYTFQP